MKFKCLCKNQIFLTFELEFNAYFFGAVSVSYNLGKVYYSSLCLENYQISEHMLSFVAAIKIVGYSHTCVPIHTGSVHTHKHAHANTYTHKHTINARGMCEN